MLIFTIDKPRLQYHFEKDKVLFSYHLGDLDEFYFDNCQWAVDYADRAKIEECILVYTGCEIPSVLAFGVSDRFEILLEKVIPLLPPKFYCHFFEEQRAMFTQSFKETSLGHHHKMKLNTFTKADNKKNLSIINLNETHIDELQELYSRAYPGNYFIKRMIETEKYYGCKIDNRIVAVTGVHVDSDKYKVSVLGNVVTDKDYRGQGISTVLTSRLLEELTSEDKMVCLNVKADNQSAISSYTKLGFVKTHDYEEALFELI